MTTNEREGQYICGSVTWKNRLKTVQLLPGDTSLTVPLSGCVSEGDTILIKKNGVFVQCRNGLAQLLPSYMVSDQIKIGGNDLDILVKEITSSDEVEAYEALAGYHYRNAASAGRYARLIVRSFHPLYPSVIGYIELATTFYMNKARSRFMNSSYDDGVVSWHRWSKDAMRAYTQTIVRIARCVVHTEFRGLGVGQLLIRHAEAFARKHWHSGGFQPLFIEISADMLKYVPFAERAGMTYIGDTEGNLHRVYKDLQYLLRNADRIKRREIVRKDDIGIVREQANRMERAQTLMQEEGLNEEEFLQLLQGISPKSALKQYALLHDIIRLPKPTYIKGLSSAATEFVARRSQELQVALPSNALPWFIERINEPISLRDVTASYSSKVRRTYHSHAVQQAFNISPDDITSTHIHKLSLEIQAGDVVLITGPSGSGKTTLLERFISPNKYLEELRMEGSIDYPANYRQGTFQTIRSQKPLIDALNIKDVQAALHLMGLVGLSDAYIYLKRFSELSKGQQFRAQLAKLIISGCNVWLIDEFCSNLDSITAAVVADKLQRVARQLGATVVVAAAHASNFIFSLRPDKVLHLTSVWEHRMFDGAAYIKAVEQGIVHPKYVPLLNVPHEVLVGMLHGDVHHIVGLTERIPDPGSSIVLSDGDLLVGAHVVDAQRKTITQLRRSDAQLMGYQNRRDLQAALAQHDGSKVVLLHVKPSQDFVCGVTVSHHS